MIECTTSSNNTVSCLYSADCGTCATDVPHSLQNLAVALNCVPHDLQERLAAGQSAANIPCAVHLSIVSPLVSDVRHIDRHLRDKVLRPPYVV